MWWAVYVYICIHVCACVYVCMCTYAYVCVCACVCGLHSDHHAIVCVMDEPTSVRCLVVVTTQVVDTVTTIDNVVSDTLVHCVCMCVARHCLLVRLQVAVVYLFSFKWLLFTCSTGVVLRPRYRSS